MRPKFSVGQSTTWCACRPWTEIVAPLRQRFSEGCWILNWGCSRPVEKV